MIVFITSLKHVTYNQLIAKVREAAILGVDYILLREPNLDYDQYKSLAQAILQVLATTKTELIIAHHKELAQSMGLKYHVSLNQYDEKAFSISIHNKKELENLKSHQYAFLSLAFESTCKPGKQPLDWDDFKSSGQVVALGGIHFDNAHKLKSYVDHVAIMSAWLVCDHLSENMRKLKKYYKKKHII